MKNARSRSILGIVVVVSTLVSVVLSAVALDYEGDILPILKEHCFKCHSDKEGKVKGNLAFDDLPDMRDYQRAKFSRIRPGNPGESPFLHVMKLGEGDEDFMPRNGAAVPAKEVAVIEKWIADGAAFKSEVAGVGKDGKENQGMVSQEMLDWKNREGKTIKARFVRMSGDSVLLLLANGKSYQYPLSKLSDESQEQAKKMAAAK